MRPVQHRLINTLQHIGTVGASVFSLVFLPVLAAEAPAPDHFVDADKMVPLPAIEIRLETLEEKADRIAIAHGIATSTLRNLVRSESGWNPDAIGDDGRSFGLVQIHLPDNPTITEAQARDPEFALTFAAERLAAGESWRWTVCSCVKSVRVFMPLLPRGNASDFVPNGPARAGGMAIYRYSDGEAHVGYIREFLPDGTGWIETGANITPCLSYERVVYFDDPHLIGFASY